MYDPGRTCDELAAWLPARQHEAWPGHPRTAGWRSSGVPERGGHRPQPNVIIRSEDLESRARAAMLDLGGTLTPESLRMPACDAAVVPIVINGKGQPLGVGRPTRVIPDGIRRAVAARDGGCARGGRPPSSCELHHILQWASDGETEVDDSVMLCRVSPPDPPSWRIACRGPLEDRVRPVRASFFVARPHGTTTAVTWPLR